MFLQPPPQTEYLNKQKQRPSKKNLGCGWWKTPIEIMQDNKK